MDERALLEKYERRIASYLDGETSTEAFHDWYLDAFKTEPGGFSEETYQILNDLFLEVEAYCPDPALRGEHEIDADELRIAARETQLRIDERLRRLPETGADGDR